MGVRNSLAKLFLQDEAKAANTKDHWEADLKIHYGNRYDKQRTEQKHASRTTQRQNSFRREENSQRNPKQELLGKIRSLKSDILEQKQNYNPKVGFSYSQRSPRGMEMDKTFPNLQKGNTLVLMA